MSLFLPPRPDAEWHCNGEPHYPCGWVQLSDYGFYLVRAAGYPVREGLDNTLDGFWCTECTWDTFRLEHHLKSLP